MSEQPLTRVWRYESPVYQAKFSHETEGEPEDYKPGWVHFHPNPDDQLVKWLEDNFLFRVPSRNPSFHSEIGYAIVSKDDLSGNMDGIHAIHPKHRRLQWGEKPKDLPEDQKRDDFYYWELTIHSQPFGIGLPKALEDKLKEWNYKEVEEFKPYK